MKLGWVFRGSGYANTVSSEGWERFAEQIQLAADHFTQAHQLHPDFPDAAAQLIQVSMAGGAPRGTNERYWFDQAVKAQFDYMPAYNLLAYALRPRWSGSHEAMLAFGLECLETGRFDTAVPFQLVNRLAAVAGELNGDYPTLLRQPGLLDKLMALCDGYQHAAPEWYAGFRAGLHFHVGDYEAAYEAIKEEGDAEERRQGLNKLGLDYYHNTTRIRGRGGPAAQELAPVVALITARDYDTATTMLKKRIDSEGFKQQNPFVTNYIEHLHWVASRAKRLETGQWVDLTPGPRRQGWFPRAGWWSLDRKTGVLTGRSNGDGLLYGCEIPIGRGFELEGRLEVVNANRFTNGGAAVGIDRFKGAIAHLFLTQPGQGRGLYRFATYNNTGQQVQGIKATSDFRLVVDGGRASYFINGQKVFDNAALPGLQPDGRWRVGIGADATQTNPTVRFSNLRLRVTSEPVLNAASDDKPTEGGDSP